MRFKDCKYDLKGNVKFDLDNTHYEMTLKDTMEIVYLVYDALGLSYDEPDKLMDLIEKE